MIAKIKALVASIEAKYAAIKAAIIAGMPTVKLVSSSALVGSLLTLLARFLLKI